MQAADRFEVGSGSEKFFAWEIRPKGYQYLGETIGLHIRRDLLFVLERKLEQVVVFHAKDGIFFKALDIPNLFHETSELYVEEEKDRIVLIDFWCSNFKVLVLDLERLFIENKPSWTWERRNGEMPETCWPFQGYSASECKVPVNRSALDEKRLYRVGLVRGTGLRLLAYNIDSATGKPCSVPSSHNRIPVGFLDANCVCFDNLGQIVVGYSNYYKIRVFNMAGYEVHRFKLKYSPVSMVFDFRRGRLIFSHDDGLVAIECNTILPQSKRHIISAYDFGSRQERAVIYMILLIRQVKLDSALSLLPNEILFLIFEAMVGL